MRYQALNSCLQCPHLWLLKPPWCTPLHRPSLPLRHPPLHPHGILLQLHRLHRLLHRHHCRALHTHLTTFTFHYQRKHLWLLQMNLHHRQLRLPQSFAPTRNLTNHVVQLQKPLSMLHYTTTGRIGPSYSSSTTTDFGFSTRPRTTSAASPPRCTCTGPYTAYTIAYSNNTTFNHAPTCTESTTHRTWSSGPSHHLSSSHFSASPPTCSNVATA